MDPRLSRPRTCGSKSCRLNGRYATRGAKNDRWALQRSLACRSLGKSTLSWQCWLRHDDAICPDLRLHGRACSTRAPLVSPARPPVCSQWDATSEIDVTPASQPLSVSRMFLYCPLPSGRVSEQSVLHSAVTIAGLLLRGADCRCPPRRATGDCELRRGCTDYQLSPSFWFVQSPSECAANNCRTC